MASTSVVAAASSAVAASSAAAGKNSNSNPDEPSPFDLEDELAALDAAVLDDLAEAGALADLSKGDPSAAQKVERPVPTDPSKRHRKRRSGEKGLSAAILRALTEEAMNGGMGLGAAEGDDEANYCVALILARATTALAARCRDFGTHNGIKAA